MNALDSCFNVVDCNPFPLFKGVKEMAKFLKMSGFEAIANA